MAQRRTGQPKSASGGATPTQAQRRLAAERAAAARERIAHAQRRRQYTVVGSAVGVVLVVIAALIIVKIAGGPDNHSGAKTTAVSSQVLGKVATVPTSTLNSIGVGDAAASPAAVTAPALTSGGKPEILYVGAEYCPYCAAERWAVAVALSRFGTLHGVGETASSADDVYPSTPTLSFHGASLQSSLLSFVPRELESNKVVNGRYQTLDKLTATQQAIVDKYNAPPYQKQNGTIPFIDIGGRYLVSGAGYDPGVLQGKTHEQVANSLADPASSIARSVDGTANLITAAICATTAQKPAAVCTSAGVAAAAAKLGTTT